ncbi:MAG: cobalamin-dependent protein [Candidatus Omnitrophica bacterium]|nr:cobalamin-dependent protein [Candidatus Omnitrophota bacterium]
MSIRRILLVTPRRRQAKTSNKRCIIPVGIAYIGATLEREGYEVQLLDSVVEGYNIEDPVPGTGDIVYGLSLDAIEEKIRAFEPDLVGISCRFSSEIYGCYDLAKLVKKIDKNIVTVIGGLHPSYFAREILKKEPCMDYVILGEGEYRLANLISRLNAKENLELFDGIAFRADKDVILQSANRNIDDLDNLPLPARHLLPMDKYISINVPVAPYPLKRRVGIIMTSRGCAYSCLFCASCNFFGHAFRARSIDNIMLEMKELVDNYGIEEFQFLDDNLTWDRQRAKKLFTRMRDELDIVWCTPNGVMLSAIDEEMLSLMRQSGCYQLSFSVESASKRILREVINKPLDLNIIEPLVRKAQRLGISLHGNFVIGFPDETPQELRETFRFMRKMRFNSVSVAIVDPIPGSRLYELCEKKDLFIDGLEETRFNSRRANIKVEHFKPGELEKIASRENQLYNLSEIFRHPSKFFKKYIVNFIRKPNSKNLRLRHDT